MSSQPAASAYQAITTKRDTREYDDRDIPEDVLHRILQAGRMAGSAKNVQPVHLVVIRSPEQKARVAECGRFTPHIPGAPVVIALVLEPEADQPEGEFAIFRGPFDAGRAAQNIMVAAWAEGVTSCPASLHDQNCARDALGLPRGYVVANLIALGYPRPGATLSGGRPRRPLDDTVHQERW
jgi:nitroreductase